MEGFHYLTKRERIVIFVLTALTAVLGITYPLLLSTYSGFALSISREYRPGELADEDVVAPSDFSFIDEVATNERVSEAASGVLPIFQYSLSTSMLIRERFRTMSEAIEDESAETEEGSLLSKLKALDLYDALTIMDLAEECLSELVYRGIFSYEDVQRIERSGYQKISVEPSSVMFFYSGQDIATSSLITSNNVYSYALDWAGRFYPMLSAGDADLIASVVAYIAEANVTYDEMVTILERGQAAAAVPPVLVEIARGEYIIKRDTIVTEQQLRTIRMMSENPLLSVPFSMAVGYTVFIIVMTVMLVFLLFLFIRYKYRLFLYITMLLIGIDIFLTFSYVIVQSLTNEGIRFVDPFLPFLFLPLLASSLTGKHRTGFAVALLLGSFAVIYPTSRSFTFFYILAASQCCMLSMREGKERLDVIYQTLFSTLAVSIVTIITTLIYNLGFQEIVQSVLVAAVNTILSFTFLSVSLPILEKIFNIPTAYRLYELSYSDTPTLNRLSQVAPGTWNHSKNVSEMAYEACKAINANAELALVSGLYHDIGKAEHPEYFIENQSGKNAHDEINNTLSAAIIKSHVKVGAEKAKEIKLPQEVIDIISEHHGNDIIRYFYNEAVREAKDRSIPVSEEDFRYSGNIPSTPESAVVMLADCTEAATRTLKNPNHQKYDKFISSIIIDKMNHKQLNNSGLTLNDLEKIKGAFIHYLMGRDHSRIEY